MRTSDGIAAWLFDRLDLDSALAGDLLEECARGRSAFWYWRQVAIAICLVIWRALLDHKLLALRAVVTGSATSYASMFLFEKLLPNLAPLGPTASARTWIMGLSLILLIQSLTGWVVFRTHRAQAVPMVTAFAIWLIMLSIILAPMDAYLRMLLVDAIDQPRFRPYLAQYLATVSAALFVEIVGVYGGGTIGARSRTHVRPPKTRQRD
jgi:hypothetical protein